MSPSGGRAFDWIVLTAANARQAEAYQAQLDSRIGRGALSEVRGAFAIADARDARIGSGAATCLAIAELARRLLRSKRAGDLAELFAGERVLVLHSGGDSRRLPTHAVEGKLFAPIPVPARGTRCATVFDLLIDDLARLAPRDGGEVLVGAGDAVIGFSAGTDAARAPALRLPTGPGVIGVAGRTSLERASRHGVFVAPPHGGTVRGFLQKPDADELRRAGAILPGRTALVDLGLFSFDPRATAALLAGSGVRLRGRRIAVAGGSLADRAGRAELPPVDLYREIAMALPATSRRSSYLATCGGAGLAGPLGDLFDAMRGIAFRVAVAEVGEFLHVGTMREMLEALCGPAPRIARFGVHRAACPIPAGVRDAGTRLVVLDSIASRIELPRGRAILDASRIEGARLGGDNVLSGVTARGIELPASVALFTIMLAAESADVAMAAVTCGIDDDFKTRLDAGGTFLGRPIDAFLEASGLEAEEVVAGDGSLWDARLWIPTREDARAVRSIAWMWRGDRAPRGWRAARRLSLRELVLRSDASRVLERRARLATAIERGSPVAAIVHAAAAGDLPETHVRLVGGRRDLPTSAVAPSTIAPLHAIASAATRARALATSSCVAASRVRGGSLRARALRGEAFAAVGDAVLARLDLPSLPPPAAIMHDQAVWTSAPVRIDLAGGWTDTPPICNETGGSVVNVAVTLRGQLPVQVVAKVEEERVVRITSTDLGETRTIRSARDLADRGDPRRWSSLAENALVLTGAVPADPRASLDRWLARIGGGISLTMFSAVPKGSGLGTSSILGAATIHSLDRLFGRERSHAELFAATSALEQMLATRGGWQDQVGGIVGGFKIARTAPGADQRPEARGIEPPPRCVAGLEARAILYYSGERRMAKNILENVVWNHLTHERAAREAVAGLHENARRMEDALARGDLDACAAELERYRRCKRLIDPGSCPPLFERVAHRWRRDLAAWCFAGAGGGGFMLLLARDASAAARIRDDVARDPQNPRARAFDFEVDRVGLRCAVL